MRTLLPQSAQRRWLGKGALALAAAFNCAIATPCVVAAPAKHTVLIEGMQFSPKLLEVKAGDTVEWINKDPFAHDATSTGRGFRSRAIAPNARWSFVPRRKGSFAYACTLHPMMKASLIVR